MKLMLALAAASVALLTAPLALAQDAKPAPATQPDADDVRCILVGLLISTAKDPATQKAGEMMTVYYAGRFEVAAPGADLAAAVREQAPAARTNIRTLGPSCGDAFNGRMRALIDIGERLAKPEAATPP